MFTGLGHDLEVRWDRGVAVGREILSQIGTTIMAIPEIILAVIMMIGVVPDIEMSQGSHSLLIDQATVVQLISGTAIEAGRGVMSSLVSEAAQFLLPDPDQKPLRVFPTLAQSRVGTIMWGNESPLADKGKLPRSSWGDPESDRWCCAVCMYTENLRNATKCGVCDSVNYTIKKVSI